MKSFLCSERLEYNILPNLSRKENVPVLPHQYQMTVAVERFLLFDSAIRNINRMFILATDDGIAMLANSSQWFGDVTLKLCPGIFFQLCAI